MHIITGNDTALADRELKEVVVLMVKGILSMILEGTKAKGLALGLEGVL